MLANEILSFLSTFFEQIVNGLTIGIIYSLMGIGLNLIYGMMSIVNFANGEFYMIGGYLFYVFSIFLGLNPFLAMPIAIILSFGMGALVERGLLRPIYKLGARDALMYSCFITFGLQPLLENLALFFFGPFYRKPPSIVSGSVDFFGFIFSAPRLAASAIGGLVILVLFLVLRKSVFGRAVRAIVQNRDAAKLVGIDVKRMNMIGFGIGIALTAIAGMLLTPIFMLFPTSGSVPSGKAFAVVVLGGMGSVEGAALGGLVLGLAETLGAWGFGLGLGAWRDLFGYLIILLVMLFRPKGLRGK